MNCYFVGHLYVCNSVFSEAAINYIGARKYSITAMYVFVVF